MYYYFMPINLITDEIDKFFEKYKLMKFTQEEIDNLTSYMFI